MLDSGKGKARSAIEVLIAFAPCLISLYVLYWLEYSQIWRPETAFRGMISVMVLVVGLGLSFLVQSYLIKRK